MRRKYKSRRFAGRTLAAIDAANEIIAEYAGSGMALTLRQLYYQHVARGLIENIGREYARLGNRVVNARLAGLIDWDAIEDRTRSLAYGRTFGSASDAARAAAEGFAMDLWGDQYVSEARKLTPRNCALAFLELWAQVLRRIGHFIQAPQHSLAVQFVYRVPFFSPNGQLARSSGDRSTAPTAG